MLSQRRTTFEQFGKWRLQAIFCELPKPRRARTHPGQNVPPECEQSFPSVQFSEYGTKVECGYRPAVVAAQSGGEAADRAPGFASCRAVVMSWMSSFAVTTLDWTGGCTVDDSWYWTPWRRAMACP